MKRRWNSNTWVLVILGVVLLAVGFDLGRRYLLDLQSPAREETPINPKFKAGDEAPDFERPDKAGVQHTLSSLVKKDTLLCFLCGCDSCRKTQTYLGKLIKMMGSNAPAVVSVTSQSPDFEERYREITGLPQTLLYVKQGDEVMETYRGHPCPRIYKLDGQRKVTWIGPSTLELNLVSDMRFPLAQNLGFRTERDPVSKLPLAPKMEIVRQPTRPDDPNAARGVTPNTPRVPDSYAPPGTVMGPNGLMPAHIPVAPGSSNPPGVDSVVGSPEKVGSHAGHGH